MNKVNINVTKQEKIDNRVNNTGRPVNKKSARQIRLAKQALYNMLNTQFVCGQKFKINNGDTNVYAYTVGDNNGGDGYISNGLTHVCNVNYVGRTKATGYTFIMGRKINITINLKNVTFVK
tara:strand:- start:44 stop:406 length:363 start_codon:yes stop_codon:yes gene_type:complete